MLSGGRLFVLLELLDTSRVVVCFFHAAIDDSSHIVLVTIQQLYESLEVVVDAWGCGQDGATYIELELTHHGHGHFEYCGLVPFLLHYCDINCLFSNRRRDIGLIE